MKKIAEHHKRHTTRIISKFLWLPKTLGFVTIWWENVRIFQYWEGEWKDNYFVDENGKEIE